MNDINKKIPRILLVDDDDALRTSLTKVLQRAGYSVSAHPDVNSAVRCLAWNEDAFDLVITDVLMPETTGVEFLHLLKADCPNLPVIVITAFGDWEEYGDVTRKGAFAYLCKPLEMEEFLDVVCAALNRAEPALRNSPPWDGW